LERATPNNFVLCLHKHLELLPWHKGQPLPVLHYLDSSTKRQAPSGIFKNVSAVGADIFVSPNGIHITPTQAEVTLTYSTKTCAEFYKDFGREWPQASTLPESLGHASNSPCAALQSTAVHLPINSLLWD